VTDRRTDRLTHDDSIYRASRARAVIIIIIIIIIRVVIQSIIAYMSRSRVDGAFAACNYCYSLTHWLF